MPARSRRIAWPALKKGTPLVDSDGEEVGRISTVVADETKDIFSGIAFRHGRFEGERFVPADLIEEMTEERVRVRLRAGEVDDLEPYEA